MTIPKGVRHALLSVALLVAGARVCAQSLDGEAVGDDAAVMTCLTVDSTHPLPTYPEQQSRGLGGEFLVRVRLTFIAPNQEPQADVFFDNGPDNWTRKSVLDYTSGYRLPCLAPGHKPVVVQQEFHFTRDARAVTWIISPRLVPESRRIATCLRDENTPEERNSLYPKRLIERGMQGNVIAMLTFVAPDSPPVFSTVFDGGSPAFAAVAARLADGYRMPCLLKDAAPFFTMQTFVFQAGNASTVLFKPMNLSQFLGAVDGVQREKVTFDFGTMGCPFDLKLTLYRPYVGNRVGMLGTDDPNRREFVEWLKTLALKLSPDVLRQVIGSTIDLHVPCGVLDLR